MSNVFINARSGLSKIFKVMNGKIDCTALNDEYADKISINSVAFITASVDDEQYGYKRNTLYIWTQGKLFSKDTVSLADASIGFSGYADAKDVFDNCVSKNGGEIIGEIIVKSADGAKSTTVSNGVITLSDGQNTTTIDVGNGLTIDDITLCKVDGKLCIKTSDGEAKEITTSGNGAFATTTDITNALQELSLAKVGDDTKYITSITQTNGKVTATSKSFPTILTTTDITNEINKLDVTMVGGTGKYITSIKQVDGKIVATADTFPSIPSTDDFLGAHGGTAFGDYTIASTTTPDCYITINPSSSRLDVVSLDDNVDPMLKVGGMENYGKIHNDGNSTTLCSVTGKLYLDTEKYDNANTKYEVVSKSPFRVGVGATDTNGDIKIDTSTGISFIGENGDSEVYIKRGSHKDVMKSVYMAHANSLDIHTDLTTFGGDIVLGTSRAKFDGNDVQPKKFGGSIIFSNGDGNYHFNTNRSYQKNHVFISEPYDDVLALRANTIALDCTQGLVLGSNSIKTSAKIYYPDFIDDIYYNRPEYAIGQEYEHTFPLSNGHLLQTSYTTTTEGYYLETTTTAGVLKYVKMPSIAQSLNCLVGISGWRLWIQYLDGNFSFKAGTKLGTTEGNHKFLADRATKTYQTSSSAKYYYPLCLSEGSSSSSVSVTSGYKSINITNKLYASPFSGSLYVTSLYQSSDDRLKDYVSDLDYSLEDILSIPTKKFVYKDNKEQMHIGTSAQSLQAICPEVVSQGDEYLNVDYSKLAVVAIHGLKEMNKRKDQEIEELKSRLSKLEALVEQLMK